MTPSKRRLTNAIRKAHDAGTLDARLTMAEAQTVTFYKRPALFWKAGSCGNSRNYIAYISERPDLSVYLSQPDIIENVNNFEHWRAK